MWVDQIKADVMYSVFVHSITTRHGRTILLTVRSLPILLTFCLTRSCSTKSVQFLMASVTVLSVLSVVSVVSVVFSAVTDRLDSVSR